VAQIGQKEHSMRKVLLLLTVFSAACGGTTSGVSSAEIQAFNAAASSVSTAAAGYGTQAAAMTSAATCTSAQGAYDPQARPKILVMQGMGPGMDRGMGSMGHMADEDMACASNAMMAELDRHAAIACASAADMTANKAEAQQHVATMTQWANHQMVRSDEMGSMMGSMMGSGMGSGMGGMAGGGMTTGHCVHNADGSYTMMP
jgi:hypothetical protein